MLLACQLAGLSARRAQYAGIVTVTQSGLADQRGWLGTDKPHVADWLPPRPRMLPAGFLEARAIRGGRRGKEARRRLTGGLSPPK